MPIIGVLVAIAVVATAAYLVGRSRPTVVTVPVFPRVIINSFTLDKEYICPTSDCGLSVAYDVSTSRPFDVKLIVTKPNFDKVIVSTFSALNRFFAGNDPLFNDSGLYTFTLEVNGAGLSDAVIQEHQCTVFTSTGGNVEYRPTLRTQGVSASTTIPLNISLYDIYIPDNKTDGAAICTKYTTLKGMSYNFNDPLVAATVLHVRITREGRVLDDITIPPNSPNPLPNPLPIEKPLNFELLLENAGSNFTINTDLLCRLVLDIGCL